jgi:cholesterol oxidase
LYLDRSLDPNEPTGSPLKSGEEVTPIGLTFTERMVGFFSTNALPANAIPPTDLRSFEQAAALGQREQNTCEFTLTITSPDLDQMLADPSHSAEIAGTVTAPSLSAKPMTVVEGEFNLFVADPDNVETRLMRYRMRLAAIGGEQFVFDGFKVVHDDGPLRT